MIKIYTKVFNRPLLVETMEHVDENDFKRSSDEHHIEQGKGVRVRKEKEQQKYVQDHDERRKRAIGQEPGQYAMERRYEEEDPQYDENNFED